MASAERSTDQREGSRLRGRAAAVTVLVMAAALGGYQLGRSGSGESLEEEVAELSRRQQKVEAVVEGLQSSAASTTVPDVVGLSLEEAQDVLRGAGFRPAITRGDVSAGEARVVAQEPGGGLHVPAGATVGLRTAPLHVPR